MHALVRTPAARFVVVGVAMTALHLAVFGLLVPFTMPEVANVVAFLCAMQVNFTISYLWTWSSRRPVGQETVGSVLRRAVLFLGSASAGFGINAAVFSVAHRLAGLAPLESAVTATAASAAGAFLLSSHVVFARQRGGPLVPATVETRTARLPGPAAAAVLVSTVPARPETTRGNAPGAPVEH